MQRLYSSRKIQSNIHALKLELEEGRVNVPVRNPRGIPTQK